MAATAYLAIGALLRPFACLQTACALLAWMAMVCSSTAQDTLSAPQLPPSPVRSRCGRFYVSGGDNSLKLVMLKWLERTTDQVSGIVGLDMPFDRRSLWVILRDDSQSLTGRISISSSIMDADLVQRIVLTNCELADAREAREALCRLLIEGYVLDHIRNDEAQTGEHRWRLPSQSPRIPAWLWRGLSMNLFASERQRGSGVVLDLWQSGRIPSLGDLLADAAQSVDASSGGVTRAERDAVYGILVAWIADQRDQGRKFNAIFQRIAVSGLPDTEWMARVIPDCASVADLEQAWDAWLIKQRRMVYEPGALNESMIDQLDAALLLCPEFSGTPWPEGAPGTFAMRDMVAMAAGGNMAALAMARANALRSLSLGRSDRFRDVTEAYCAFLRAVADGRPRKELEDLLAGAEASHAALREDVRLNNLREEGERR